MAPEKFEAILATHPSAADPASLFAVVYASVWDQVKTEVFALNLPYSQLNFPHEGGVTAFFSRNMTPEDLKLVSQFLKHAKLEAWNTRAFKTGEGAYTVTVGSISEDLSREEKFQDCTFNLKYGEFAPYLKECVHYLEKAVKYAADENQQKMIELYIEFFQTGQISVHKDAQRRWIADKGPVIEMNMGWIETYIDPENIRGDFEGWVAVVNKARSEKFNKLV